MIIKAKFDSARRQICDYCGGEISPEENKVIIGMTPYNGPWLWIYHPVCYACKFVEELQEEQI